ncbi:STAS domain-containing protein [Spirillospora sp. CA-253888]
MTDRAGTLRLRPHPSRVGLRVEGEINVTTREVWARALEPLVSSGTDVELDLGGLVFVDVGGVAVLVTAAERLSGGRRMILREPPRPLIRTLDVMFPQTPAIEVTT